MEQIEFQKYLTEKLSRFNGEIIIVKNDNVIYSSNNISKIDAAKCLETGKDKSTSKIVEVSNKPYAVEIVPFTFSSGTLGNAVLLAPVVRDENAIERFAIIIILVFVISFIITNVFMSYSFSKE